MLYSSLIFFISEIIQGKKKSHVWDDFNSKSDKTGLNMYLTHERICQSLFKKVTNGHNFVCHGPLMYSRFDDP